MQDTFILIASIFNESINLLSIDEESVDSYRERYYGAFKELSDQELSEILTDFERMKSDIEVIFEKIELLSGDDNKEANESILRLCALKDLRLESIEQIYYLNKVMDNLDLVIEILRDMVPSQSEPQRDTSKPRLSRTTLSLLERFK